MDRKSSNILNFIFFVFLGTVLVDILSKHNENKLLIIILSILIIGSSIVRHLFLYEHNEYFNLGKITLIIDSALIYWIILLDKSDSAYILLYILIGDSVVSYSYLYSGLYGVINLITSIVTMVVMNDYKSFDMFLKHIATYILSFIFVYGFMFVAKYQIKQKEELDNTTKELQRAYEKLKETNEALEEVTILKERNRIAGEIHDTVGHTLTTVLIEIEAGKRLIAKDKDLAIEKLDLAQGQVRKGLNDIRKSVRTLKDGDDLLEFTPSLISFIKETEKHGDLKIDYDIDKVDDLNIDIKKTIYRAMQEGITNGIRHGSSKTFKIELKIKGEMLYFDLADNGKGCDNIKFGFGLTNMNDRVKKLKGQLKVGEGQNNGCKLSIRIPIKEN